MNVNKYLYDIKQYSDEIYIHLKDINNFEDYKNNLTVKRAVERCLEIIGEAMNNLLTIDPDINITGKRQIIALRNKIIHGYDKVSDQVIWNIVKENLTILNKEVENHMKAGE